MTATLDASTRTDTTREARFPFTLVRDASDDGGDGLTFEGYAAVFNSPTEISDQDGDYTEVISPGAFKRSLGRTTPVLMFDHGKHPLIGPMPLGKITDIHEDDRGLFVRARLTDNWLIQPVRDAIRDGAIDGMSFRFEVMKDAWTAPVAGKRTRTLKEVRLPEVGPVVFPAYGDTTASVRSALGAFATDEHFASIVHLQLVEARDETFTTHDPTVSEKVSDALETLWGISDDVSDVYITEYYEDRVVFVVVGTQTSEHSGLWTVGYKYDGATGTVALDSAPVPVQAVIPRSGEPGAVHERSDVTFRDITDAVEDAIETAIGATDMDTCSVYVDTITDTWAVFAVCGSLEDTWPGYWKVDYTMDATSTTATIGTPQHVEEVFVPSAPPARFAALAASTRATSGTSDGPAPTGTPEELAERATTPTDRNAVIREIALRERGITTS